MSRGLDRDDREELSLGSDRPRGGHGRYARPAWRQREEERDDRRQESDSRELSRTSVPDVEIRPLPERRPTREREQGQRESVERRHDIRHRDRRYRVRESELETLHEVGRFRTVSLQDLNHFRYGQDLRRTTSDLRSLREQGLIESHRVPAADGSRFDVVVLSERGRTLAARPSDSENQRFFSGLVKPREVVHDAGIYRLYHAEAEQIRAEGGEVKRVVLDHELKAEIFGALERQRNEWGNDEEFQAIQHSVAQANGLQVVDRKIPLPDLQIEYQTREGDTARVNLELTTEHYKGSQVAAKARAGFKLYALGASSGGSPVRDEREVTADILSL